MGKSYFAKPILISFLVLTMTFLLTSFDNILPPPKAPVKRLSINSISASDASGCAFDIAQFPVLRLGKDTIKSFQTLDYKKMLIQFVNKDLQNSTAPISLIAYPTSSKGKILGQGLFFTQSDTTYTFSGMGILGNLELSRKEVRKLVTGALGLPSYDYLLFIPFKKPGDDHILYAVAAVKETMTLKPFYFKKANWNLDLFITSYEHSTYIAIADPSPPAKPCENNAECDM